VKLKEVLREMLPLYVPLIVTLGLITYVPAITTWVPRWAVGGP
jgi:TRAP-type C4-dicarboxylate transport system permease large subunit